MLTISEAGIIDIDRLKKQLVHMGYEHVGQVDGSGQFAIRGGIIDIYPLTEENPYRIELWDDEVDTIRAFDVESQRSIENVSSLKVYPASEVILSEEEMAQGIKKLKKELKTQEAFETAMIDALEENGIDLIVLAGFMSILSERFTSRYDHRILNIHPSLIPSFCGTGYYGLRVHEAALEKGVKVTGATVHFVNEIPDGGEIIAQKAVEVMDGDTPELLQRRVMEQAEWIILPRAIDLIAAGRVKIEGRRTRIS